MNSVIARDFMTTRLITLSPRMDVFEAINLLLRNKISGAPVVDQEGKYIGIFSEKCCMSVLVDAAYEQLPTNEVFAFVDSDARTVTPETDLLSIAQLFLSTHYRRLPVLDGDRLVGQVSRRDVIRVAMEKLHAPPSRQRTLLYLSALVERVDAPLE